MNIKIKTLERYALTLHNFTAFQNLKSTHFSSDQHEL